MSPIMDLIARTGQTRKVWIGIGAIAGGGALLILSALLLAPRSVDALLAASLAATAVAVFGAVYLVSRVACPQCGARWFRLMATTRPGGAGYMHWRSEACAKCGYTGR